MTHDNLGEKIHTKEENSKRKKEKELHIYLDKQASFGWVVGGVFLFSVGLAIRVTMIHVLTIGAGVREALEALGALERFFAAMQPLVFS